MLRILSWIGLPVLTLLLGGGLWLYLDYQDFLAEPLNVQTTAVQITVAPGASMKSVARNLAGQNLLERPYYLAWRARERGVAHRIRAGEYQIQLGTTVDGLLDILVQGEVIQYSLTIPEGWTFREMLHAVRGHEALEHTLMDADRDEIMKRLGRDGEHPEGRFFPDTYLFPRGTSDLDFLQRAYATMERHLLEQWQGREPDLPLASPYEALILASIVERETGRPQERDRIAGVFVRRLERDMKLQTDPTVIYGMGERFDGNIRRADLKRDTPYNTYVHHGLPPTPIALPGVDAIHAALHPAHGSALYFVARGDGSHVFSDTLAAHNRAVRQYQLHRRSNTKAQAKSQVGQ